MKPAVDVADFLSAQSAVTDVFVAGGPRRDVVARVVRSLAEHLRFDAAVVWTCAPPATRIQCAARSSASRIACSRPRAGSPRSSSARSTGAGMLKLKQKLTRAMLEEF